MIDFKGIGIGITSIWKALIGYKVNQNLTTKDLVFIKNVKLYNCNFIECDSVTFKAKYKLQNVFLYKTTLKVENYNPKNFKNIYLNQGTNNEQCKKKSLDTL